MAAPLLIAAGIGAAATGASALYSNWQRKKEYKRQRADQLADWERQNKYNDPAAQKKRLQEAGLNAGLMYGQSAGGASGNAGPIGTTDLQATQFKDPIGSTVGSALASYFDFQIKAAQTDNLRQQAVAAGINNTVADQTSGDKILASHLQANKDKGSYRFYDKDKTSKLAQYQFQMVEENARKNRLNNNLVDEFGKTQLQERIALLRKQGKNVEADTLIKKLMPFFTGAKLFLFNRPRRH